MIAPVLPTYKRTPFAFERGEGARLFTTTGQEYLDFGGGIAVASLGHCHPALVEALQNQAAKLWHTSNLYEIPGQERLARRLTDASFADTVFFTNSGAEALECAIKMARKFQSHAGKPERYRIITFEGAFHGRTLATIAAGGQAKYLEGFGPKVDGFDQVPFADHEALKAAITDETAAILIEPIQGAGTHGSTFGGNPLAMAVGNAVLDVVLADGFLDNVTDVARYAAQKFASLKDAHPNVIEQVRGAGLMLGLKTKPLNSDFVNAAYAEHLLTVGAGDNVVRLLPPLIITKADIDEAVQKLERACLRLETKEKT